MPADEEHRAQQERRTLIDRWRTRAGSQARSTVISRARQGRSIPTSAVRSVARGRAPFRELDLRLINLSGQSLDGSDFADANLQEANLARASLRNADLSNANLRGALLRNTDFTGANLAGADLRGAFIEDATLTGADLTGTLTDRAVIFGTRRLQRATSAEHEAAWLRVTESFRRGDRRPEE